MDFLYGGEKINERWERGLVFTVIISVDQSMDRRHHLLAIVCVGDK